MKTHEERVARRAKIKAFFQHVADWFKMIELKLEGILPVIIDTSLKVMTWFKAVANSEVIDFITHFTPTQADDIAVEKIRGVIEKVIDGLTGGKYCMDLPTFDEKIKCFIEIFKNLPLKAQSGYLKEFHSGVIQELSDNRLSDSESSVLAQQYHLGEKLATV